MSAPKWTWQIDRSIPSDSALGRAVIEQILDQLKAHHWKESDVFAVHLALEEAVVNAIKHGNRRDKSKQVRIRCGLSPSHVRIEVTDEGTGFDPAAVPDCRKDENLEMPSGRGILLMRSFMTLVEYNDRGNCVVMEKNCVAPR